MADLLLDIIDYLKAAGLVSGDGIDAFRDFAPEAPDSVVVLYEYAGVVGFATAAVVRSVQVVARDGDAATAKQKVWAIFNVLDSPDDRILNLTATRWAVVEAKQTPFKIGVDESNRVLWGFNLGITTYRD